VPALTAILFRRAFFVGAKDIRESPEAVPDDQQVRYVNTVAWQHCVIELAATG
jgi:hypothetical protein